MAVYYKLVGLTTLFSNFFYKNQYTLFEIIKNEFRWQLKNIVIYFMLPNFVAFQHQNLFKYVYKKYTTMRDLYPKEYLFWNEKKTKHFLYSYSKNRKKSVIKQIMVEENDDWIQWERFEGKTFSVFISCFIKINLDW